ncbi:uncharacterized protein LOC143232320 isoform X2 [Tachypleus tridentatus]|uniref:uncharacterized protein LOC143232320 isoform X2 n=1 Tax=Tachypleus tridentatus TaxID=6853 RepID=UPI003FD6766B
MSLEYFSWNFNVNHFYEHFTYLHLDWTLIQLNPSIIFEPAAEFVKENLFNNLPPKLQNVLQQPGISKINQFLTERIEKTTVKDDGEDKEEEKDSEKQHSSLPVSTISVTSLFTRLITEEILSVDKQLLTRAKAARSVASTGEIQYTDSPRIYSQFLWL